MKLFGIPLDLGGLVALITLIAGALFFLINIYTVNLTQAAQIASLTSDVQEWKQAWPYIQRSLGRIEGKLGIASTDKSDWHH